MTQIQASITAAIRPTSMIFQEQPTEPWTKYDFLFLEAYQIIKNETCPKCGHPIWLCRSDSNTFDWEVRDYVCAADRALRAKEYKRTNGKTAKPSPEERREWGREYYAIPEPHKDAGFTELPTRRDFYNSLS